MAALGTKSVAASEAGGAMMSKGCSGVLPTLLQDVLLYPFVSFFGELMWCHSEGGLR